MSQAFDIEEKKIPQDECFNSIKQISTQMAAILDFGLVVLILEYKDGSFIVFFFNGMCVHWRK